jgi:hypothetical protein
VEGFLGLGRPALGPFVLHVFICLAAIIRMSAQSCIAVH